MSPEQAEGEPVDEASDTYSLALTLYECWAGENPVRRATPGPDRARARQPAAAAGLGSRRPAALDDRRRSTAASTRIPSAGPALDQLRTTLEGAIPKLDGRYAVPTPAGAERRARPARLAPLVRAGSGSWSRSPRRCVAARRPRRAPRPRRCSRRCWSCPPCSSPARRARAGAARGGDRPRRDLGGRGLPGAVAYTERTNALAVRARRDRLVLAARAPARRWGSPPRGPGRAAARRAGTRP